MTAYMQTLRELEAAPRFWLVTGAAGFIGSNLVETLLRHGQRVRGLDNLSTGHTNNLDLGDKLPQTSLDNFTFMEGDIREAPVCASACAGVDIVLHEAALGSVPDSIADPLRANACNVDGFVNMLTAARDAGVKAFIYASSSAVYGDSSLLPKREESIGRALSPYAVSKYADELYAGVFASCYGFRSIGLRYFNIFGKKQDPDGAYAAVIPQWFSSFLKEEPLFINGDGSTTRDFCFIDDCVQANILAACAPDPLAWNQVYNVACGRAVSLLELFHAIRGEAARFQPHAKRIEPERRAFRSGDILHSLADISKIKSTLGFKPQFSLEAGLAAAASWYAHASMTN